MDKNKVMEKPLVHILLPVHNRLASSKRFINCLLAQTYTNYHLILIDDGSTDGSQEYVKGNVKSLTVIVGQGDWWWGGGLHQGYLWLKHSAVAGEDIVLMINNDTEFDLGFLQTAVDFLVGKSKTLLLAQAYSKQNGSLVDAGVYADWKECTFEQAREGKDINCFSTRGLFLRVRDFLDIGGFHPVLLPHYGSDYEFTIRAYRKGYDLVSCTDLSLRMDEEATGYHIFGKDLGLGDFLRRYFSKRSAANPIYWFSFVLLACPWPWKAVNLIKVAAGAAATILKRVLRIGK